MADKYENDGVVVMETVVTAGSKEDLANYVQDHDYLGFRTDTEDPAQMKVDYEKTEPIASMAIWTLIDLTTMKVLVPNCGASPKEGEECLSGYL